MKLFLPWELQNAIANKDAKSIANIRNYANQLASIKVLELPIPLSVLRVQLEMAPHPDDVMGAADSRGQKFLHDADEVREGDDRKPDGYDERLALLIAQQGK